MLHIFYGPDSYSLKAALDQLRAGLGAGDFLEANTSRLEGDVALRELQACCQAAPFLSPKRLVIVEGLLTRFEPRRDGASHPPSQAELLRKLQEYLPGMPASTELVLVDVLERPLSQANPALRILSPLGQVRRFPLPVNLPRWVQERVRQEGGNISPAAAQLLAKLVGPDLWALGSEAQKLCLYAAGRSIVEEDVQLLVAQAREANVFALADAIMEGDIASSLRHLRRLLEAGAAPAYLLVMIARQLRLLLRAKEPEGEGTPPEEAAQRWGSTPAYVVERAMAQARRFTEAQVEEAYRHLLETDLAIKTGRWPEEVALELLVAQLCASPGVR